MMIFDELTDENLMLYAAKAYYKPKFSDIEEFHEDLKRFKYVKRLANRYIEHGELAEMLILNHLIVIFNSFGNEPSINILKLKLNDRHWPVIKPFLIYLKYITDDQVTGFPMDPIVVNRLREM